jgi:hypothetical protein
MNNAGPTEILLASLDMLGAPQDVASQASAVSERVAAYRHKKLSALSSLQPQSQRLSNVAPAAAPQWDAQSATSTAVKRYNVPPLRVNVDAQCVVTGGDHPQLIPGSRIIAVDDVDIVSLRQLNVMLSAHPKKQATIRVTVLGRGNEKFIRWTAAESPAYQPTRSDLWEICCTVRKPPPAAAEASSETEATTADAESQTEAATVASHFREARNRTTITALEALVRTLQHDVSRERDAAAAASRRAQAGGEANAVALAVIEEAAQLRSLDAATIQTLHDEIQTLRAERVCVSARDHAATQTTSVAVDPHRRGFRPAVHAVRAAQVLAAAIAGIDVTPASETTAIHPNAAQPDVVEAAGNDDAMEMSSSDAMTQTSQVAVPMHVLLGERSLAMLPWSITNVDAFLNPLDAVDRPLPRPVASPPPIPSGQYLNHRVSELIELLRRAPSRVARSVVAPFGNTLEDNELRVLWRAVCLARVDSFLKRYHRSAEPSATAVTHFDLWTCRDREVPERSRQIAVQAIRSWIEDGAPATV